MRLRKKPWIEEAILEFSDFLYTETAQIEQIKKGEWTKEFGRQAPLYVELGTGKGRFITQMAARYPEVNFIGIEVQKDVIYYAGLKAKELGLKNLKLLRFDINNISELFAEHEVDRFFINFCDPWPKARHAKRRLTHVSFLEKYRHLLAPKGQCSLKLITDHCLIFR